MPLRRLSLAAANFFSKSASPTAFAAARNWKEARQSELIIRQATVLSLISKFDE